MVNVIFYWFGALVFGFLYLYFGGDKDIKRWVKEFLKRFKEDNKMGKNIKL